MGAGRNNSISLASNFFMRLIMRVNACGWVLMKLTCNRRGESSPGSGEEESKCEVNEKRSVAEFTT